jgi:hypothetical protein
VELIKQIEQVVLVVNVDWILNQVINHLDVALFFGDGDFQSIWVHNDVINLVQFFRRYVKNLFKMLRRYIWTQGIRMYVQSMFGCSFVDVVKMV